MIRAESVSYRVGSKLLVRDVGFSIGRGEVVAIVGANGAGKTTLLRLISGEIRPSTGRIWFDDMDLSAMSPGALARRRAVLAQSTTLGFGFSVAEVVLLGRTPHRSGRAEDEAVAEAAMAAAGVEHLARRSFPTLSGGEQQRVHFARTLAQLWTTPHDSSGKLLLLDEPTASLDLVHRQSVLDLARQCALAGASVLAVLHDLNLASQYADTILVLCRGRQCAYGTPEAVLTREVIRDTFEVDVLVGPHPCAPCPLILTVPTFNGSNPLHYQSEHDA